MTDFDNFLITATQAKKDHPEWRPGQAYFNTLCKTRPDIAEKVLLTAADPFYGDDRIPHFLDIVRAYWNEDI